MTATQTDTPADDRQGHADTSPGAAEDRLCNADRMQRRHCAYYHEKTGRCTQSATTTWQERAAAVTRENTSPTARSR